MPELTFLQPGAPRGTQGPGLGALWQEILQRLPAEDRHDLGAIHIGALDSAEEAVPFAFTNADEDRVNLTLELKSDQLELNLVGWKETQSDALKDWLQSVRAEDVIKSLPGYEVVAFSRRGHKKTPEHRAFFLAESVEELGSCPAEKFSASWLSQRMIRLQGSRKDVKPAFHVRRFWDRNTVAQSGDALVDELVIEVRRLLPILRDIWKEG